MITWHRMYPTECEDSEQPRGYIYGTVCRVNLWQKMTTALSVTQIIIGISCVVFYMIAFLTDRTMEHLIKYMVVGLVAGSVVSVMAKMNMFISSNDSASSELILTHICFPVLCASNGISNEA